MSEIRKVVSHQESQQHNLCGVTSGRNSFMMLTTSPKFHVKVSTNLHRSREWLTYEIEAYPASRDCERDRKPGHRIDRVRWPETRDLELLVT